MTHPETPKGLPGVPAGPSVVLLFLVGDRACPGFQLQVLLQLLRAHLQVPRDKPGLPGPHLDSLTGLLGRQVSHLLDGCVSGLMVARDTNTSPDFPEVSLPSQPLARTCRKGGINRWKSARKPSIDPIFLTPRPEWEREEERAPTSRRAPGSWRPRRRRPPR